MSRVRPAASERTTSFLSLSRGDEAELFTLGGLQRDLNAVLDIGGARVAESRGLARSVLNATHPAYRRIAALAAVHGQLPGAAVRLALPISTESAPRPPSSQTQPRPPTRPPLPGLRT